MSKKVVVATDGSVTATDAKISDIFTTAISTSEAVTGTYGLVQKGLILVGGMSLQNYRLTGSANPLRGR